MKVLSSLIIGVAVVEDVLKRALPCHKCFLMQPNSGLGVTEIPLQGCHCLEPREAVTGGFTAITAADIERLVGKDGYGGAGSSGR